ncbi:MFS transporter [Kyrpidia sp.]|uniref:MFS transporter n=1 Tax=Kyrpidia sp. TaxID=2073077 RepID=UPI00258361D9|nr:MFS transporter [Kyrpidia sp.]MCL6577423.1 MFS transporter [Kyrpidia sp.]
MIETKKISKRAWAVIALLFALTVISNADKAIIGFASVPLMKELGLTAQQWGLVGSAFFFLYSICAILGGALADRFGIRKVIAWMAAIWAIVQFMTFFVSNFMYLLITRIILGAGEGPSYSLAMTAASKYLPKEKLGIGLTLVSVGGPFGVAVSAPFLIAIIRNYGWRAAFITTGVIGAVWIIFWLLVIKEKETNEVKLPSTRVKRVADDTPDVVAFNFTRTLFSKEFIFVALCGFATYWSFTVGLNWMPNYLQTVRGLDKGALSIATAIPWIVLTLSQITWSSISDRCYLKTKSVRKGRVYVLAPVLIASAVAYILSTMFASNAVTVLLMSLALSFGCITLVLGPAILADLTTKPNQGKIQGWFMAITSLGGIVGPYVVGQFVGFAPSVEAGFNLSFQITAAVLAICGIGAILFIRPKLKHSEVSIQGSVIEQ